MSSIIASIIIPERNEEAFIEQCLNSVLASDYPMESMEVIVVDGWSSDTTCEILENFDWCGVEHQVLSNPQKIVPTALNIGIKHARGQYIIRIDAHTRYADNYISKCVELLEKDKGDNVGGPMRVIGNSIVQQAVKTATSSPFGVGNAQFHFEDHEGLVDTVYLGAFKKEVFTKAGYFDEELVRNQDDEFNFRMIQAGLRIYQSPEIKSWYTPRSTLSSLWSQYFQYGFWKVRVIQKRGGAASWRHLIPAAFAAIFFVSLILAPWNVWSQGLFVLTAGVYGLGNLGASVYHLIRNPSMSNLLLPIVFGILHFSYGLGFIFGLREWGLPGHKQRS